MTLRDGCTDRQLRAHQILDLVRAGLYVRKTRVLWALAILGDVE